MGLHAAQPCLTVKVRVRVRVSSFGKTEKLQEAEEYATAACPNILRVRVRVSSLSRTC